MNIDAIRYFVAVGEYHSITKAAEILHISQSALSRHLQRFEDELGIQLLIRNPGKNGSMLTEAGEACFAEAVETLKHSERMLSIISSYGKGTAGALTIGFSGYEGAWFISWLGSLQSEFPGIQLHYVQENWRELIEGVRQKNIDLAVVGTLLVEPIPDDIESIAISEIETKIVVSKKNILAGMKKVKLKELSGIPYISYSRSMNSGRDYFEDLCRKNGVELHRLAEYDNTVMISSAVIASNGFAISATGNASSEELAYLDIEDIAKEAVTGSISFVYRKDSNSRCLKTVVNYTRKYMDTLSK